MSYDTTVNYLNGRLLSLGYARSDEAFDFTNAPASQYGKTFILHPSSGELTDDGENLSIKFYDTQIWHLKLAFSKSDMNDVINRDMCLRKIESIIRDLDDPSKWLGTLRYLRYNSWDIEEQENYFLITIELVVQDTVTY